MLDNAHADAIAVFSFSEFYIAGQAVFNIILALYFDVFFEICPGNNYALPTLPELCSLEPNPNIGQCITVDHEVRTELNYCTRISITEENFVKTAKE